MTILLHDNAWPHGVRMTILLHDNARPDGARITLSKLADLGYVTFNIHHIFLISRLMATIWTLLRPPPFCSDEEVKTAFKDFVVSKPLQFYRTGINNIVYR